MVEGKLGVKCEGEERLIGKKEAMLIFFNFKFSSAYLFLDKCDRAKRVDFGSYRDHIYENFRKKKIEIFRKI